MTDGNADILPGTTLAITSVGQRFSKNYTVSRTIHTFDSTRGYKTQFITSVPLTPAVSDKFIRRLSDQ
jgi:phage protein D